MNLSSEYPYKTELHAHTKPASTCGQVSPAEVIEKYHHLGYHAVALTNHFNTFMPEYGNREKCLAHYFRDFDLALEAGAKWNVQVLLGIEIRFPQSANDYLVFGIDRAFVKASYNALTLDLAAYYKAFKSKENLILQAHPFRDGMTLADPACIDGMEVFNMHPGHNSRVGFAADYAKKQDFILSAGTDYHHPGHEGLAALRTKTLPKDSYGLAALLNARDYLFQLGSCLVIPYCT